jgi:hypothetical protein
VIISDSGREARITAVVRPGGLRTEKTFHHRGHRGAQRKQEGSCVFPCLTSVFLCVLCGEKTSELVRLEQGGFMQQVAGLEARRTEYRHVVNDLRAARGYKIRDDFACCGSVHHAVTAEPIGGIEARKFFTFSNNSVVIR